MSLVNDTMVRFGRKLRFYYLTLLTVGTILVVWEVTAHALSFFTPFATTILPPLEHIITVSLPGFATFYGVGMPGIYGKAPSFSFAFLVLGYHSIITFFRVITGTLLGAAIGIGLGILIGWSYRFETFVVIPLLFIRTVPLLAMIPLFIVWFGGSELGVLLYIAFGSFIMLVINTMEAIRNVPPVYQKYARTLGATRGQLFRTVIIPAIVPELTGGIRVVIGLSWAIGLAAEYLATQRGLGRMMILSEQYMYTGRMIMIAFLYMIFSIGLNKVYVQGANYITRWVPRVEEIRERR